MTNRMLMQTATNTFYYGLYKRIVLTPTGTLVQLRDHGDALLRQ